MFTHETNSNTGIEVNETQKKKKYEVQNYKKLKNILSQQPGFCQLQQFFINV